MPRVLDDAQPGLAAYWSVRTQWRTGFSGRTGLDYTACLSTLKQRLRRWRADAPQAFGDLTLDDLMDDVQVIEAATLRADEERREEEETQQRNKAD